MNKISRIISVFVIAAMLSTSFIGAFAEGEPDVEMSLVLPSAISIHGAGVGECFKVGLNLNFGDDLVARGGIYVFGLDIKFDSNVLQPVDPNTLQPVVYDDNGAISEGSYVSFSEHISAAPPDVNLNSAKNNFTVLFGDTSYTSITNQGEVFEIAFMVNPEIEVEGSFDTYIRLNEPSAFGRDITTNEMGEIADVKSFNCNVSAADRMLKIRPPFRISAIPTQKQNSTLEIKNMCTIGTEGDEPLMATVTDEYDNVIVEQEAELTNIRYTVTFELDENTFAPGRYKLTLTHGATSASQVFEVVAKDEPLPEEPDEPIIEPDDNEENLGGDTSGDKDNDKEDNKTDNNTSTGGLTGGATSDKKPTVTDKTDKDKTDNKTEVTEPVKDNDVVYPNDIAGHWAKSNIEYVFDYKLMNGYADGTFGADNSITRAEFATVMSRFLGLAENPDAASAFADTEGHWAKGYIGALAAEGVVGGVSDDAFDPDSNITREQIAVILDRAFDLVTAETGTFADDAQISSWAYDGVYDVLAAGYMKGDTAGNFNPLANATRAEVATIIYRLHSAK